MKKIDICMADPIGDQKIEETVINILKKLPDFFLENDRNWNQRYNIFYEKEAEQLFDALINSLPGATIDQLLIKLLEYRASLLKVTF